MWSCLGWGWSFRWGSRQVWQRGWGDWPGKRGYRRSHKNLDGDTETEAARLPAAGSHVTAATRLLTTFSLTQISDKFPINVFTCSLTYKPQRYSSHGGVFGFDRKRSTKRSFLHRAWHSSMYNAWNSWHQIIRFVLFCQFWIYTKATSLLFTEQSGSATCSGLLCSQAGDHNVSQSTLAWTCGRNSLFRALWSTRRTKVIICALEATTGTCWGRSVTVQCGQNAFSEWVNITNCTLYHHPQTKFMPKMLTNLQNPLNPVMLMTLRNGMARFFVCRWTNYFADTFQPVFKNVYFQSFSVLLNIFSINFDFHPDLQSWDWVTSDILQSKQASTECAASG